MSSITPPTLTYTREQWARAFLAAIGNPTPTQQTINWVVAWTQFETACCGGCAYNLLNTEESNSPGVVSNCNSVGVKNFDSFANGIGANAKVLKNGLYNTMLAALQSNDQATLCNAGNNAIAGELGTWGTHSAGSIANAACNGTTENNQRFFGTATGVPTGTVTPNTTTGGGPFAAFQPLIDFFAGIGGKGGIGDWLAHPLRIVKLVMGLVGLSISLIIIFWPEIKQTVSTVTNTAKSAGMALV